MSKLKITDPKPYVRTNLDSFPTPTIAQPLIYDVSNDAGTLISISTNQDIYSELKRWFQVPRVSVGQTTYPPSRDTLFLSVNNPQPGDRIYTFQLFNYNFQFDSSGPTLIWNGPGILKAQLYTSVQ